MKFDTSKIEALKAARTRLEQKFYKEGNASSKDLIACSMIQDLLSEIFIYGELKKERSFARWAELTKEDTPDPKPYEPTEKELWELDKEASEERANNQNLYYEGYTDQQHF